MRNTLSNGRGETSGDLRESSVAPLPGLGYVFSRFAFSFVLILPDVYRRHTQCEIRMVFLGS